MPAFYDKMEGLRHWLLLLAVPLVADCRPSPRADAVAAGDPAIAAAFAALQGSWAREGSGWSSPGWRAARERPSQTLGAIVPARADEAIAVGIGSSPLYTLRLEPEGARPVSFAADGGRLVAAQAWPGTDLFAVADRDRLKLFLLADENAPARFAFRAALPSGLPGVRSAGGGLEFADAHGEARLRMPSPLVVDARGQRRQARLAWQDGRLTVELDATGLQRPILIHPEVTTANWVQRQQPLPEARESHALAWDATRQRAVLFGGDPIDITPLTDTWTFDGTGWTQAATVGPDGRNETAMAWDPLRQRVVLYSGYNFIVNDDTITWTWDGSAWSQASTTSGAGIRNGHMMAFDDQLGKVVLFGGTVAGTLTDNTTWLWDGTSWSQATVTGTPPTPRRDGGMVYDSVRKLIVMYGGIDASNNQLGETWLFDGAKWTKSPATNPPGRMAHGMAFDAGRGRTVIYGGYGGGQDYGQETWEFDGTTWSQKTPPHLPAVEHSTAMVYDPVHGRVILHGGLSLSNATWTWDGSDWTRVAHVQPAALTDFGFAYDATRKRTVLYGGISGDSILDETWEWDGISWRLAMTGSPPGAIRSMGMAWDDLRQVTVLFGGYKDSITQSNDTWTWNGTTWTKLAPATSPSVRAEMNLSWDSVRHRGVIFGGSAYQVATMNDTWEWDGTNWLVRTPASSPSTRNHARLAFDPQRARTVLYGGRDAGSADLTDLWEWDGTNWSQPTATGTAPGSVTDPCLVYDAAVGRTLLFGGLHNPDLDTFAWDGTAWTSFPPGPYGGGMRAVFDSGRFLTTTYGGADGNGLAAYSDLWEYRTRGQPCTAPSQCANGWCIDGNCCNVGACGSCQTCGSPLDPGQCFAITGADDPDSCTGTMTCDPSGACKLKNGGACSSVGQCASAFCVDGFCCDSACNNACQVCAFSLGAFQDGVCGFAPFGAPGTPSCAPYTCNGQAPDCSQKNCFGDEFCAAGYYCDPTGKCVAQKAASASCGAADCLRAGCRECASGTCASGFCCDKPCSGGCEECASTPGTCKPLAAKSATCGDYYCDGVNGACPTSCNLAGDCANGKSCILNACSDKLGGGKQCVNDAQCQSNVCAGGVCCNTACDGACHSCDATGACIAKAKGASCGGDNGCNATCDANGSCVQAAAGTRCDTCKICDGSGHCNQPPASNDDDACGPIPCSALSTECRVYGDQLSNRCVGLGLCAPANDPTVCTSYRDLDGAKCSTGVCQSGACVTAPDMALVEMPHASGCSFAD